jgi:hypothetical protein
MAYGMITPPTAMQCHCFIGYFLYEQKLTHQLFTATAVNATATAVTFKNQ